MFILRNARTQLYYMGKDKAPIPGVGGYFPKGCHKFNTGLEAKIVADDLQRNTGDYWHIFSGTAEHLYR